MKKLYEKFSVYINYLISSGISFFLDLGLYTLFILLLEDRVSKAIIISSYLARAISSFINYLINKNKVFKYDKKDNSTMYQYFLLVIINVTLSSVLVTKIVKVIPVFSTIIKAFIDVLIFIANFFIQKLFIFNKNKKESKYKKYFLAILAFVSMFIELNKKGIVFNYEWYHYICMGITLPILVFLYVKVFKEDKKTNYKSLNFLAGCFTFLMLAGYSFKIVGTLELLISSELNILINIIKCIGFYSLFKNSLYSLYKLFTKYEFKNVPCKLLNKFNEHPFIFSCIVLFIVYGIYLLMFYPGVINYDNANQIKEVMGMHTRYLDSIVVMNDNITLTNFNPIIHTLLLGGLFKLGYAIGNVNFGMFLYTLIQVIVVVLTLAYSISFLHKEKVRNRYLLVMLGLYVFVPYFPFYAITAVKDTLFSMAVLVYIIKLYQFIKYDNTLKQKLLFMFIIFLVILLRNNGIYLVCLSLPFVFFAKKNLRKTVIVLTVCTLLFNTAYGKLLTYLEIPGTSIREMLSIPFQQTARYVKYYSDEVTDEEREVIDKILTYDTLGKRYRPELSDKVKNEYNRYATSEELKDYFIVWGKMLVKRPMTYVNSTVHNIYGYFYPDTYKWYLYTTLNNKLPEAGFDYHFIDAFEGPRLVLSAYGNGWREVPVLKLFVSCGMYTWAYVFLLFVLLLTKKRDLIIILLPAFALLLTTIAGPANTYFRYVVPYAMALPVIIGMVLKDTNKSFTKK